LIGWETRRKLLRRMDIRSFFSKGGAGKADKETSSAILTTAKSKKRTLAVAEKELVREEKLSVSPSSSSGGNKLKKVELGKKPLRDGTKGEPEEKVPYAWIAEAFEKIEAITKRLDIQDILRQLFLKVLLTIWQDLIPCVYISCSQLAPAFHGVEIGVGDALLKKAIMNSLGQSKRAIDINYSELGDLGLVAQKSKRTQRAIFNMKSKKLDLRFVFDQVRKVADTSSQDGKEKLIHKLLLAGSGAEVKYIVRLLQGKLRIGLAEQTVLISLAQAFNEYHYQKQLALQVEESGENIEMDLEGENKESGDEDAKETTNQEEENQQTTMRVKWSPNSKKVQETSVEVLKQVQSEHPVYEDLITACLKPTSINQMWYDNLRIECGITAGVPVKPMLAKPTKGITVVLNRFEGKDFTCEYKYDGERAQIHMVMKNGKPSISVYSRNSENNTVKYPDISEDILSAFETTGENAVTSFIVDSEAVAYDEEKESFLPFQILSTRARKDVTLDNIKVKVIVCAFDLLFLNGKSLLETSLEDRRALLRKHFKEVEHKFSFAVSRDGNSHEQMEEFLAKAIEDKCEGLMVKVLKGAESYYQPARRSLNWLKLKKDYMDNLGDSVDLVPIGAMRGKGKRTGTYGAYILASYDEESEMFQSVTKLGTGFKDDNLKDFTEMFKQHISESKPREYSCGETPDVWFKPAFVWEVKAADLSLSPLHTAAIGKVDPAKGIALRFPRFIRAREDKAPEDATSSNQIVELYQQQQLTTATIDDDDMY